jgi:methylenetetrahydrofolate reductase (NADPH)
LDKRPIQDLVKGFSIETTVRESQRIDRYADIVPEGTKLYIAHVPGTLPQDTVALAARLRRERMEPVPHIVARRIESAAALDEVLGQLVGEAGVSQVLVVAGDIESPSGELDSGLQILDSGLLEKHGIRKIGVAGHPEGHRAVTEPVLRQALARKNEYARRTGADVYVVTQFVFAAEPIIAWEAANGPDVNRLPYMAGLPGLATIKTLLKYALDCGVGPSLHAISKHAANLTKLLTVQTPDELLVGLAAYKVQNPHTLLSGIHFFPFGGLKRTADWLNKIAQGDFDLTGADTGLSVRS